MTGPEADKADLTLYERRNICVSFLKSLSVLFIGLAVSSSLAMVIGLPVVYVLLLGMGYLMSKDMNSGRPPRREAVRRIQGSLAYLLARFDFRVAICVLLVLAGAVLAIEVLASVLLDAGRLSASPMDRDAVMAAIAKAIRSSCSPALVFTVALSFVGAALSGLLDGLWLGAAAARHGLPVWGVVRPSGAVRKQRRNKARARRKAEREGREYYWRGPRL